MAVSTDKLTVAYSALVNRQLRRKAWIWNTFDNRWEGALQTAYSVQISNLDEDATAQDSVQGSARGADWTEDKAVDIDQKTFTMNNWWDRPHEIPAEDQTEVMLDLLNNQLALDTSKFANNLDDHSYGSLRTGVASGNRITQESTGTWNPSLVADMTAAEAQYNRALGMISLMLEANALGNDVDTQGGYDPAMPIILSTPTWMLSIQQYLSKQGYTTGWDALAKSMFESGSSPGASPLTFIHLGCRWIGATVAKSYTSGSDTVTPVFGYLRSAVTVAKRPVTVQLLTPQTNQTGPNWAIRQRLRGNSMSLNPQHAWSAHAKHKA